LAPLLVSQLDVLGKNCATLRTSSAGCEDSQQQQQQQQQLPPVLKKASTASANNTDED